MHWDTVSELARDLMYDRQQNVVAEASYNNRFN